MHPSDKRRLGEALLIVSHVLSIVLLVALFVLVVGHVT